MYFEFCECNVNTIIWTCTVSKEMIRQLQVRQDAIIKMALGLSKFSRVSPLTETMNISPILKLYYKFKYLFFELS